MVTINQLASLLSYYEDETVRPETLPVMKQRAKKIADRISFIMFDVTDKPTRTAILRDFPKEATDAIDVLSKMDHCEVMELPTMKPTDRRQLILRYLQSGFQ